MDKLDEIKKLFQNSQAFFIAVGDPVRQELLMNMMGAEILSVKQLASRTKLSRPTISHHLKILKDAQIIVEHKEGREIFYRPQPGEHFYTVKRLMDTIDEVIKMEIANESR